LKPPTSFVILLWCIEIPSAAKDVFGEVQWLRAIGFGSHDEAAVFLCESMGPCDLPVDLRCINSMYQKTNGTKTVRWPKVSQFGWEEGTKHRMPAGRL